MMKKKNCGILAAAVVLLITALVIGCMDPSGSPGFSSSEPGGGSGSGGAGGSGGGFVNNPANPLPGMRYLTVDIDDSNARTIRPDSLVAIASYKVILTYVSGSGSTTPIEVNGHVGSPIIVGMEADTIYSVLVEGYEGVDATGNVLATGTHANIDSDDIPNSVNITMQIIDTVGTGTFGWDFSTTLPPNFVVDTDSAVITFDPRSSNAAAGGPIILTNLNLISNTGTQLTLNSGYYRVTITMTKSGHFNRVIEDALHIYQNQTTIWTPATQFSALLQDTHTIMYDVTTGTGTVNPETGISHGATIATAPSGAIPPTNYELEGWFTANGTPNWGNEWVFGATRVFGSATLFARWQLSLAASVNITTYTLGNDLSPAAGVIPPMPLADITFASGSSVNLVITIDNAAGLAIEEWRVGGNIIPTTHISTTTVTDDTLTIDFLHADFLALATPGTHNVTVIATSNVGTVHWGGIIPVVVQP
jgi:hypothetical protein